MTDTIRDTIKVPTKGPTGLQRMRRPPSQAAVVVAQPGRTLPSFRLASLRDLITWLDAQSRALGQISETSLVFGLMLIGLVAHGLNMLESPSFTWLDDEGTYVAEAWAILRTGQLAHYTYMYGHVPGGWILLAGLMLITGGPRALDMPVDTGRLLMLILHVAMVPLLYRISRKLGCGTPAAALAAFVFSVSPLAIFYQRIFLLDNAMLFWTLVSLDLLLNGQGRLSRFALSGLCFGLALLTKETDLFLVPVLLYMVWKWRRAHQGRFAIVAWLLPMIVVTSWYPLYAVLKGELLPEGFTLQIFGQTLAFASGPHVSLLEALLWQGGRGGGGIFDPNNEFWYNARAFWMPKDSVLLFVGMAATAINLLRGIRCHRTGAASLLSLLPIIYLDHGGIVFQHYVLFAIPFLCLNIAVLVSPVFSHLPARHAAILAVVIAGGLLGHYWQTNALQPLFTDHGSQTGREVIVWIKQNLPAQSMIVTRDSFWPDLHEPGLEGVAFPNVHDHWQVGTNPAIRDGVFHDDWHNVDYLLMMPDMWPMFRDSKNLVALDAYNNSCRLKEWKGDDGNTIELWRVDKSGASRDKPFATNDPNCATSAETSTPASSQTEAGRGDAYGEYSVATLPVPAMPTPALHTDSMDDKLPVQARPPHEEKAPVATVETTLPGGPGQKLDNPMNPLPSWSPDADRGRLPRVYFVKAGDSLSSIAYRFYGDAGAWRTIAQANAARLPNPNVLTIGQPLLLPDIGPRKQ
jgi:4-amino-4-deoxy-L-arabinose transferase-like glycosyltransferase